MEFRTLPIQNIKEALEAYLKDLKLLDPKIIPPTQTAVLRFTVPGWGGPIPKGKKSTAQDVKAGLDFLSQLPLEVLNTATEAQEKTFNKLELDKKARRQPRHYLLGFIRWSKDKGVISNETHSETQEDLEAIYLQNKRRNPKRRENLKTTSRLGHYDKFALGVIEGDFINESLEDEFKKFDRFQAKVLDRTSKMTRERARRDCLLLLGWLYRFHNINQDINLSNISLSSLIPVIVLYPQMNDSKIEDYWISQAQARQRGKELGKNVVNLIRQYFDWRAETLGYELSYQAQAGYLDIIIALAKFLYHNQTDLSEANNYEDIPIVRHLQKFRTSIYKKHKKTRLKNSHRDRMISWEEIIEIREKVRNQADLTATDFYDERRKQIRKIKRDNQAIARDMQRFLLLAFLTVTPPDRQRTFRELRLGHTLKYGIFSNERFIPQAEMQNPDKARWYIHLNMDEYKTSKTYGEWIGELPDEVFDGNKTFYNYLDRWLYHGYQDINGNWHGWRDALNPRPVKLEENGKEITNDFLFVDNVGKPFSTHSITSRITNIFKRLAGVAVNPHLFRAIFRTHLKNTGASIAEQESAAYWMKHDIRTAETDYTFQERDVKLRPAIELMNRLNRQ